MTARAKNCQILCDVIAQLAPPLNVMNLKIFGSPTGLTAPPIPLENLLAKLAIGVGLKL